jgi:hypothetical protein
MLGVATVSRAVRDKSARREFTIRVSPMVRERIDELAIHYNLRAPDGTPRDAEIVRILLVCALCTLDKTRNLPALKAAYALYSNGLMFLAQGLWLGLYDIREDLAAAMRTVVAAPDLGVANTGRPGNPAKNPDRYRVHVKVDDWIRKRIDVYMEQNSFSGKSRDSALVVKLVEYALNDPVTYEDAFNAYVQGMVRVRKSLIGGLTEIRDTLRVAVLEAAGRQ